MLDYNDKLKVAVKLMKDVYIPKKTSHLPLEIAYITNNVDKETSAWIQTNTRFYYPLSFVDYVNSYYPSQEKYIKVY